jgi:predicted Ser/Thr protein kinase
MADDSVKSGRILAGRYRLEQRLGVGGMGAIWRAEHLILSAPVAVKLLDRDVADSEENVARFMREAKAAANLRSTHVVQILDYGVDESLPFIVMELLEGETLRDRLKRQKTLEPVEMARIVTDVCRAMARAHEAGVVHRDLKPENIFLVQEADTEVTKVLDFGVAKVEAATLGPEGNKTRTGSLLGTPYYMSPEQAQGNKQVDHRSDLWSLAVIAFECLTGKRPFMSDALGDLVLQICIRPIPVPSEHATVPAGFDEWFARATAREPQERFQSAREMADALRECLGDEYLLTINTVPEETRNGGPTPAAPPGATGPVAEGQASEPAAMPHSQVDAFDADEVPRPPEHAVLDDTVLATEGGAEAAQGRPAPARHAAAGRALLYVVGAAALGLGVAVGIWASLREPRERALPDVQVAALPTDLADARVEQRADAATVGSEPDSASHQERAVDRVEDASPIEAEAPDAQPDGLAPDAEAGDAAAEAAPVPGVETSEQEQPDAGEPEPVPPELWTEDEQELLEDYPVEEY